MNQFNLTITVLEHGWASLSIDIDKDAKTLCFENVPNDPLFELLESALRIVSSIGSKIMFCDNPQRDYLVIEEIGSHLCRIETDDKHMDLPAKAYCKSVIRMFDKYVFAFSIDDYTNNWSVFPMDEIERLRTKYHVL